MSCVNELFPLIEIVTLAPGCPSAEDTCTPAILPANASSKERTGALFSSSRFTFETDPVKSFFFTDPYPITTTSFKLLATSNIEIFNGIETSMLFSRVAKPTCLKRRVGKLSVTFIEKKPLISLIAVTPLDLSVTDTPDSGLPLLSLTVPLTTIVGKSFFSIVGRGASPVLPVLGCSMNKRNFLSLISLKLIP